MTDGGIVQNSRVKKTLLNAKVNFIFYFLTIVINFLGRKIFLDHLGVNFIGLTGTLLNILGYLNLAELGISAAISFNLYKPLREGNYEKINRIVALLGYYYRNIGLIVGAAGLAVGAFLFLIFRESAFRDYGVIYFAFFTFLFSALLGYFVNYRQILLVADQKNYVVSSMFQTSNILKVLVQIVVAVWFTNFYVWIAVELVFSIGYSTLLNKRISKVYPWLRTGLKEGKIASKDHPEILKSTRQVFIHKIKDFLLTQSDQLFIFIFVSLKMVAFYGNYVLITSKLMQLFNTLVDSVLASVGNLVAEDNREKMMKVFWELMAVRYFLAGMICFVLYHAINAFIVIWFGEEYLLSNLIVFLLTFNLFIFISRGTVDNFNFAFGHFADVWAAWVELILNVGITIIGGYFWGIPGILLGKTVSMLIIIVFWKPYYLFSAGFHQKYSSYWKGTIFYLLSFVVCAAVTELVLRCIPVDPAANFFIFLVYTLLLMAVFGGFYLGVVMAVCPGGKHLLQRIRRRKL